MGAEAFREYRRAYNIGDNMKSTNKQLCFDDYDIEIINRDDRDILFDIISAKVSGGFYGNDLLKTKNRRFSFEVERR